MSVQLRALNLLLFAGWALASSACTSPPPPGGGERPPFAYEALGVRNSCFVESVYCCDVYLEQHRGRPDAWARVLQWGHQDGDFKMSNGHAVAVFSAVERLWFYDVNFGFAPLDVPVDRRGDITDVSPAIYARYPQFKPVLARYREDYPQPKPAKRPEFLFYHANPDVRDATKVAHEFARFRPVSVVEFNFPENGQPQASAAAVFIYGARVCVYFPRGGTHISNPPLRAVDDLRWITRVITRVYPGASDIRPQPGGYFFYPPKS